jgi:hypothetical protein
MAEVEFEIDGDKQTLVARCPEKSSLPICARKTPGGFLFFEVHVERGQVPQALSGKYSSLLKAKEAIHIYFNKMTPTKAVKRDAFSKDFEERKRNNGTKSSAKSS